MEIILPADNETNSEILEQVFLYLFFHVLVTNTQVPKSVQQSLKVQKYSCKQNLGVASPPCYRLAIAPWEGEQIMHSL